MTKLIKKITSVIATLSIMATMITVPASAAITVEAPVASKKSGTYYASLCNHTLDKPGNHYYYDNGAAIKSSRTCYGTYEAVSISLSSNTKGAKIYFDTEIISENTYLTGEDRFQRNLKYSTPIELTKDTKITAYAIKNGVKSKSVTYTYKVCSRIQLSHDEGTYDEPISIQITNNGDPLSGEVYYTTDGTKPTKNSNKTITREAGYFGFAHAFIDIDKSCTLRMLVDPGPNSGKTSYYLTKKYVIKNGASESDTSDTGILYDYNEKYYYNTLSSTQKKAYTAMFKSAKAGQTASSAGYGLTNSQNAELWSAFRQENPQFLYKIMNNAGSLQGKADLAKLEKKANKILSEAKGLTSDYAKIKLFHDEIAEIATYGLNNNYHQTAYGALVSGEAACRGYANAFAYLCQSAGIECVLISGYVNKNVAHDWNMVKLDGNWYHVDVLWDDPAAAKTTRYTYFLVSDTQIKKDHTIDTNLDIPSAPKDYDKKNASSSTDTKDETTSTTKTSAITTRALVRNKCILDEGAKVKLTYLFSKTDGVTFKSSNKSVAKITKSTSTGTYYVKGVKEGEATITATYKGDTATLKVYVTNVKDTTSTLKVNANKSVKVGSIIKVSAVIDKGSDEYITWMTTSNKYLKVDSYSLDGEYVKFKALKKGTAKVYAITSSGKVKSITITIK